MNRIKTIAETFKGLKKLAFEDLDLSAQTSLVYSCLKRAQNTVSWYTTKAEEATEAEDNERWKYFSAQCTLIRRTMPGMFQFLNRASNYSEAVDAVVEWDASHSDDLGIEHEDVEWLRTALNGKPHAWAKRLLIDAGHWPEGQDFSKDFPLILYKEKEVANRVAGRLLGRMIVSYHDSDRHEARKIDGRDMQIAAYAPEALAFAKCTRDDTLAQKAISLAMKSPPYIDDRAYTGAELAAMWDVLRARDEDDAAEAELKSIKREVKLSVRDMLKATAVSQALAEGLERLQKAGASEGTLAAFAASMAGIHDRKG